MVEDYNKPVPRRMKQARQRQAQRYRRRDVFVTLKEKTGAPDSLSLPRPPAGLSPALHRLKLLLLDALWYLVHRTPVVKLGGAVLALTVLFLVGGVFLSPNIPPNIRALDVPLGGYTPLEAEAALMQAWQNDIFITVTLDNTTFDQVRPEQLGMFLEAGPMVEQAKGAGLSGIPLGVEVPPLLRMDYGIAQNYLLSQVDSVFIAAQEAGYAWQNGAAVGINGTPGRELDINLTLERLRQTPDLVLHNRRLELISYATQPNVSDPAPYLAQAQAFLSSNFRLVGYDPFVNEFVPWATTQAEMAKWLAAGANSLTVREDGLRPFITALNDRLKTGTNPRYLDAREVARVITSAVALGEAEATLRIRYLPLSYEIAARDIGYSISRKTGMPFGLIDSANPGLDWNTLSIGQRINLPSPDELLPQTPVPRKRIVVDLDRLWLVAYEDGAIKFSYPISIGRDSAPTYPGVFQILNHNEVAYGSSFTLCSEGSTECGQWEMQWFMGIYEVVPGLMNGFHGDVLLPNGALLGGGGGAQSATTFGCVMADNNSAKNLYDWAEVGTMVEILSFDYPPRSDLGQQAYDYIRSSPQIITG